MDLELKPGQMVQDMKANIRKEKNKEKENLFGQINLVMKEILLIIIFMDMENIFGQMEDNLKELG